MAYNAKKTEHAGPKKVLAQSMVGKLLQRRRAIAAVAKMINSWS